MKRTLLYKMKATITATTTTATIQNDNEDDERKKNVSEGIKKNSRKKGL